MDELGKNIILTPIKNLHNLKLNIITHFLKENVIIFDEGCGYVECEPCANLAEYLNSTTNMIVKKKPKTFDSRILIIPQNDKNKNLLNYAIKVTNLLKIENDNLKTDLALTMANKKIDNIIELKSEFKKKFLFPDKFLNQTFVKNKVDLNGDYIFYPCMNLKCKNGNNIVETEYVNYESNVFDRNCFPYRNVNGIYGSFYNSESEENGIFVKKIKNKSVIPNIFHHVWLNQDIIPSNFMTLWENFFKGVWKNKIWTQDKINSEILTGTNKWTNLFTEMNDFSLKYLIACLAILEKYGGITINSLYIPLKDVPDEIKCCEFAMSFFKEKFYGKKLSYDIIISVPKKTNIDIFNELYDIISSHDTKNMEKKILSINKITIFPSYYFHPDFYVHNRNIMNQAVTLNLNEVNYLEKYKIDQKCETQDIVNRIYNVTHEGIIKNISENPLDKIKNKLLFNL